MCSGTRPAEAAVGYRLLDASGTELLRGETEKDTIRFSVSDIVEVSRQSDVATLDADKVSFPLILRPIREGDRFQPFGMTGSRLVSDYLTDRKRTLFDKRRQLVITDRDDTILWLVGERTDNRFAVDGNTHRVLTITMEKCN